MKLYRDNDGKWVGTQAEAHNKDIIEVPVDKPGLLEWLNANCATATVDRQQSLDNHHPSGDDNGSSSDQVSHCPKCNLNLSAAHERVERELASCKADAIADWIKIAPTGRVAEVFIALADRYQERGME